MDSGRTESVEEAAERLGMSTDAVRKRARRGTIPAIKQGGRLRILVPDSGPAVVPSGPPPGTPLADATSQLVDELRARVAYLERQADAREAETSREKSELRVLLREALTKVPPQLAPGTVEPEATRRPWWQFWRR